jgi:hypothetical protein
MNRLLPPEERNTWNRLIASRGAAHRKIGFEITDYGVIKRRLVGDETEEDDHWRMGHPIFFPNILWVGPNLQFRVPLDDSNTLHIILNWRELEPDKESNTEVPFREVPFLNEKGQIELRYDIPGANPLVAGPGWTVRQSTLAQAISASSCSYDCWRSRSESLRPASAIR